jgi:hypothetical protein
VEGAEGEAKPNPNERAEGRWESAVLENGSVGGGGG